MLLIFESVLPIFLLVLFGIALRRAPFIDQNLWTGLEQLGFYVLFPSLLFITLARTDFAAIPTGVITVVTLSAVLTTCALTWLSWPLFKRIGVPASSFTTIFQTTTRWNGFVALAVADKLVGQSGLTIIALVMAVIIVPINIINVVMLEWFSGRPRNHRALMIRIVTNPLILSSLAGVFVSLSGIVIYEPLMTAIDLVSRSALSLGLIMVGAGLVIADALRPSRLVVIPVILKLFAFPALMVGIGMLAGVKGMELSMLALAASVPTAMNGYLLAKKMGGDAQLYSAVATVQTAVSFISIPLILLIVGG
jgi:malonate transporter and related proteins